MATPLPSSVYISVGSSVQTQTGMKWSTTMDGAQYGRDMYAEPRYVINAKFEAQSETAAEELEEFLNNYRTELIEIVLRQYTYHVYMVSEGVSRDYIGGDGVVNLSAVFRGVRV